LCPLRARAEGDHVSTVVFVEEHVNGLAQRSGKVFTHVIGTDRQLTVPTVNENRKLNGSGAANIAERVQGRSDSPARKQHIISEDDQGVVDAADRDPGRDQRSRGTLTEVIAVHGDIEGSDADGNVFHLGDAGGEPMRPGHPAGRNSQ
jgi:hypothetical protein